MSDPAPMAGEDVPRIAPAYRLQWEEAQDCYVLLYPEGMIKLNTSAAEILKRCNGKISVSALTEDLRKQFPDTDIEADVHKFLEVAHGNGWLISR